jgi:hypothetical protein
MFEALSWQTDRFHLNGFEYRLEQEMDVPPEFDPDRRSPILHDLRDARDSDRFAAQADLKVLDFQPGSGHRPHALDVNQPDAAALASGLRDAGMDALDLVIDDDSISKTRPGNASRSRLCGRAGST